MPLMDDNAVFLPQPETTPPIGPRPVVQKSALLCVYVCGILISVMPNKTIYVKDTDLPLLEQAQEQLGDSVSSMFAEFLRERVAKLTPEENRIIELINEIVMAREALRERSLPEFIDGSTPKPRHTRRKLSKAFVRPRFRERKHSSGQPTLTTIGRRAMRRMLGR